VSASVSTWWHLSVT